MMLKQLRLALLSAAVLFAPSVEAALKGYRKPAEGAQTHKEDRNRRLKHSQKHQHHLAIQQAFATQSNVYDDDLTAALQEVATIHPGIEETGGFLDAAESYYGYHEHEVEFLPLEITPKPFINCLPESFHKNNKVHAKQQHYTNNRDKQHLNKHHEKEAKHHVGKKSKSKSKSKSAPVSEYDTIDASPLVPVTTYAIETTGKGKGKGEYTHSQSKSKGAYYYRQRNLAPKRRGHYGTARRGNHHGWTTNHQGGQIASRQGGQIANRQGGQIANRQGGQIANRDGNAFTTNDDAYLIGAEDGEIEETEPPEEEDDQTWFPPTIETGAQADLYLVDGEPHLPICPNAPERMNFGPIPTMSPRDPQPSNATAPTVAPPGGSTGGAPVNIPPGTERILVESTLSFGLEDDNAAREATPDEIAGLLMRTSDWYTQELKAAFPTLQSFEAVFLAQTFDANGEYPIQIDFDANGFFTEGADNPTPEELFKALQDLDYQNYIMEAVWTTDSTGGMFEMTQRAAYKALVDRNPDGR